MDKIFRWLSLIAVLVLTYYGAMWGYENYQAGQKKAPQGNVLDIDKECRIVADTRQCTCRHRETNERLEVHYEKCISLAR
jgi:hypothetical protein